LTHVCFAGIISKNGIGTSFGQDAVVICKRRLIIHYLELINTIKKR